MNEELPKSDAKGEYEAKKQERERARQQEGKRARGKKNKTSLMRYAFYILIVGIAVYGIFLLAQSTGPEGEDFSTPYDIQGRQHIEEGAEHPAYNSNPPSSGWHYAQPARTGFYDEPLPDERVVHNLEHGDIWIAYNPSVSDEAKETLESFAGSYVIVTPRAENEGDISLVAWGRVDTFDIEEGAIDEQRIQDFIDRYDNRGPEKVRSGSHL